MAMNYTSNKTAAVYKEPFLILLHRLRETGIISS
jgi:hypothetical protein